MTRLEFVRRFRQGRLQKQANFAGILAKLQSGLSAASHNPLGASAMLMAGLGGADYLKDKWKAGQLSQEQSRAFYEALQMFPELQDEDPQKLKVIWNTVRQFSPHVATNPALLGTYLKNTVRMHGAPVLPSDIKQLQDLELGLTGQMDRRRPSSNLLSGFGSALGGKAQEDLIDRMLGSRHKHSSEGETELARVLRLLRSSRR